MVVFLSIQFKQDNPSCQSALTVKPLNEPLISDHHVGKMFKTLAGITNQEAGMRR